VQGGRGGGHSAAVGQGVPVPSLGAAGEEVAADAWLPGLGASRSQLTRGVMGPSSR